MISEAEIPLAILHCSTEKYCNPMYKFAKLLKRRKPNCDSSENSNLDTQNSLSNLNYNIPAAAASMNIKQRIIPETLNIDNQEPLQSADFVIAQTKEKENDDKSRRNCDYANVKRRVIPETLNINSPESLQSVDFVVTIQVEEKGNYDKSRNCDYGNTKHRVIPETSSCTINSQKLQKSNIDFVATPPTKKQKYNKSYYIEETPNDVSTTVANVQTTRSSNENNSTFANVSLQTTRYSNRDNQSLHKHENIQDEEQLQKLTFSNDNETELKVIQSNSENNIKNSNKDLNNSDDLTSNLRDKNREKQSTTCCSIDNRITRKHLKQTVESDSSTSENCTVSTSLVV